MEPTRAHFILLLCLSSALGSACSSTRSKEGNPEGVPSPTATSADATTSATQDAGTSQQLSPLDLPHPRDATIRELKALFKRSDAPLFASQDNCDFDYGVEKMISGSPEEFYATVREHVRGDPKKYHWCFYAKALNLEREIKHSDLFVDEKQKLVLNRYLFFVHIGKIYREELGDPKYFEFAVENYRRINRKHFGRELKAVPPPPVAPH